MNLMTLLRLSGVLVFGWTALALGVGALGVGGHEVTHSRTYFIPSPSLHDALPCGRPDGPDRVKYHLLDRTTGRAETLNLPEDLAWSLLSVSPWRDQDGSLQAIGRWVCRLEGQDEFCGLALLRLPDMTLKSRINLDVLPTGKPCWVPGRPGEVLFSAGNGQLYRCSLGDRRGEDLSAKSQRSAESKGGDDAHARAVTWDTQPPGSGVVYLDDPAWSSEPALRHLVFVALSMRENRENRRVILPSRLWWLVMNEEGDAIVAAGPLTESKPDDSSNPAMFERMPNVVIGAGDKISLVYLTRAGREQSWRLRSAPLELDSATGRPRVKNSGSAARSLAEGLAPASLVVSADGESVYAIDCTGQTHKHSLSR
jgi:hypothetical protein